MLLLMFVSFSLGNMVRTYVKKTNRVNIALDTFRLAYRDVLSGKNSIRQAAQNYNINFMTLYRYIKKEKAQDGKGHAKMGYSKPR